MEALQAQDFVAAQLYASESDVWQEAIHYLLLGRPELRIALAVYQYQSDEEITIAKAASLAGVSIERMKEILVARGVQLRIGPQNLTEALAEASNMEQWFHDDSH